MGLLAINVEIKHAQIYGHYPILVSIERHIPLFHKVIYFFKILLCIITRIGIHLPSKCSEYTVLTICIPITSVIARIYNHMVRIRYVKYNLTVILRLIFIYKCPILIMIGAPYSIEVFIFNVLL